MHLFIQLCNFTSTLQNCGKVLFFPWFEIRKLAFQKTIQMNTRLKSTFLAIALFVGFFVRADEGMWFLMFIERLNHRDMEKLGLQLTTEEIYSINHSSIKDAVVQFNGGCTAEIISKDGLILTNHHCGFDAIAELSTPEKFTLLLIIKIN